MENGQKNKDSIYQVGIKQVLFAYKSLFYNPRIGGKEFVFRTWRLNLNNKQAFQIYQIKQYFNTIEKNTKVLKVDGGYHELHNEIEKYRLPYFDFLRSSLTN